MRGSCIIDGVDLADYGMFILRGGSNDLLSMPERKKPETINYYEINGVDVDLSEIYFKEKNVVMRYHISAESGSEFSYRLNDFYRLISKPGVRTMYVREFARSFVLRYEQFQSLSYKDGLIKPGRKKGELVIQFVMDDPLQLFTNPELLDPVGGRQHSTYVLLDVRDLSEYGIIVRECYNTILRHPAVKKPLTRSFKKGNGLLVAEQKKEVTFETKNITVSCTMIADSRAAFYNNYEALFNALSQKEELELTVDSAMDRCYYSAMKGFKKESMFDRRVKVSFDLEFVSLDKGEIDLLLATEDRLLVVTEDGEYYIDLNYYGN